MAMPLLLSKPRVNGNGHALLQVTAVVVALLLATAVLAPATTADAAGGVEPQPPALQAAATSYEAATREMIRINHLLEARRDRAGARGRPGTVTRGAPRPDRLARAPVRRRARSRDPRAPAREHPPDQWTTRTSALALRARVLLSERCTRCGAVCLFRPTSAPSAPAADRISAPVAGCPNEVRADVATCEQPLGLAEQRPCSRAARRSRWQAAS